VSACDFMDAGKTQMVIEPEVEAALVFGNRLRGEEKLINRSANGTGIGMNVVTPASVRK